ncbi:MAG: UbiA family prenyltransferase [Calditrichaeota bacterium]|nr:UbiA family prenyltransferase [Calditrichota bacterium]
MTLKWIYDQYIRRYLGWRNWAVFYYNSIIENLFIFFVIALVQRDFSSTFLLKMVAFILFSLFSTTYGYLINDFSDRRLDALHGKPNTFHGDSTLKALGVLAGVVIGSAIFAWPFVNNPWFVGLWAAWFFMATFYSLPPLRFKERGKLGLVLVVFAQRVIPALILFAAFHFTHPVLFWVLLNYVLIKGFNSDINHQLEDYENDLRTQTRTSAVELGKERLEKIFRLTLYYERLAMLLVLIALGNFLQRDLNWPASISYFPLMGFGIILLLALIKEHQEGHRIPVINPFKTSEKDVFQFLHLAFPHVALPLYFLGIFSIKNWHYLIFLIILGIVYRLFDVRALKSTFIGKLIFKQGIK